MAHMLVIIAASPLERARHFIQRARPIRVEMLDFRETRRKQLRGNDIGDRSIQFLSNSIIVGESCRYSQRLLR